jgi:hypothetical protein
MTRHREPTAALTDYVDALVGIGGQLTTILNHMWEHESPEAPLDPAETLARLLEDTIPERWARRDVDLKVATRLINATSEAITDNLFLVADPPDCDDEPCDLPFDGPLTNGTDRLH